MSLPAHVVGIWASVNAALALGILAFGDSPIPILVHVGGSAIVAAFGLAVLVSLRRRGVGPTLQVHYRSVASLAFGMVGLVGALSGAWGVWFMALMPYPLAVGLTALFRERTRPGTTGGSEEQLQVPVPRAETPTEARAAALKIAHERRRHRRGEAT